MLGGMWGLPSTTWHDKENPEAGIMVGSVSMKRHVRHVFTHFSLNLHLHRVALQDIMPDKNWRFVSYNKLQEMGLPSLYQKVVKMIEFQEL